VISDEDVAQEMHRFGGSFIRALAQAWYAADIQNRMRIQTAFPDYWTEYADIVRRRQEREHGHG